MLVTSFMYDLSIFVMTWRKVASYLATSKLLGVGEAEKLNMFVMQWTYAVHIAISLHLKESV